MSQAALGIKCKSLDVEMGQLARPSIATYFVHQLCDVSVLSACNTTELVCKKEPHPGHEYTPNSQGFSEISARKRKRHWTMIRWLGALLDQDPMALPTF